jgi:hypothetical protein
VWKRLSREERLVAATHFWRNPPEEMAGSAVAAVVKARHLRPQVARALPLEDQARALAGVLDPGEPLAASLLVALHLGERRDVLRTFLDAAGLRHEDGVLADEEEPQPLSEQAAKSGVAALAAAYPRSHVESYLNTLWLQDPDRWRVLEHAESWL